MQSQAQSVQKSNSTGADNQKEPECLETSGCQRQVQQVNKELPLAAGPAVAKVR